jgi:hypothetical protein
MRSRWRRRAITTSASRSAASTSEVTWKPACPGAPPPAQRPAHASKPRSSVLGAQSQRSAPAAVSDQTLERATRECRTSPRITTFFPRRSPRCARIV